MASIRGKDTKPELNLRKELWRTGLRYRIGHGLPGKPDIVFVSQRVVVFVDGCFWHQCPIHATRPKANRRFWQDKLRKNVLRDRRVNVQLNAPACSIRSPDPMPYQP